MSSVSLKVMQTGFLDQFNSLLLLCTDLYPSPMSPVCVFLLGGDRCPCFWERNACSIQQNNYFLFNYSLFQ